MTRSTAPGRTRPRPGPWRRAAAALLALAVLPAAASCTGTPPAGPAAPGPDAADRTLTVATGSDLSGTGVRRRLILDWAARNRVRVRIVRLSDDADRQRSQLVAALQSRTGRYDVVNLDVTWTAEFADGGLIQPLHGSGFADLLDHDTWPAVAGTARRGGRIWAVPWNTDVGLLYYRRDLLPPDRYPPPRSWDDLAAATARFARSPERALPAGQHVRAGLLTQLKEYEGLTVNTLEAVWRGGGRVVDDRGRVAVGSAAAQAGLDSLLYARRDGGGGLPLLGADSLRADESASLRRFLAGESLYLRNWPYAYGQLKDARDKPEDRSAAGRADYGVLRLPWASALGGQNLAVAAGSAHRALAEQLVADLTGPQAERCLFAGGFAPARPSALTGRCRPGDPAPDPAYTAALRDSLDRARARPATPYYAAFTRDVQDTVAAVLRGTAPAAPAATVLADRLRRSLSGH
ncbi:extracellular solute-binding protein [Streptacidiphilus sp. ASG 303]|uniref:extracellular solute-binding protein n=1 Tax=Streptacidiphilus sp. ASG 303 TaxID=2896847 RepID=UPI001E51ADB7|nr:extracellular solute-binding protein [Streptacidiphilus sp. ASG 303]MCD0486021.1 extracellular solute-binding protein [Streptacidiphilus sp. ASG 303]